ncbi:hypothetical protein TRVA0_011S01310 [Trichomonascus vanleenenianus]|uniref:Gfo/Idh/MocA family protein n=1 Tax=Trichomonascus vanleenenianus TaxID=2268995 RepID=UPI003EC9EE6C
MGGKTEFTLRWGILATGGIAAIFTRDLLAVPAARGVTDVKHEIVAIASSTSVERARQFAEDAGAGDNVECYGTYEELVANPNVDIIYVATPHGMHYENCKLCLEAGKNVLCEKAFTINEPQARHLIEIAREKRVFLMEAVWTRFFPLMRELQRVLFEERILGKIYKIASDCSLAFDPELSTQHRLLNPDLGGGALLDLGIYALTWVFVAAYDDPDNQRRAPKVASLMTKHRFTHVDETTVITLRFPSGVIATASTSMVVRTPEDCVCRISGEKGEITVQWAPFRPESFTIYKREGVTADAVAPGSVPKGEVREFKLPGHGMFYEADECARCIRDGKLESDIMPLEESRVIMEVMDTVRKQNDFTYPIDLERVYR